MVVGKTNPDLSISSVFREYSEVDILAHFFNVQALPCCICSPLRKDDNPSFGLYVNKDNHVRWIDYSTSETGGLMDLLQQYWRCSLPQALCNIHDSVMSRVNACARPKKVRVFTHGERGSSLKVEVKVRAWRPYDFDYWNSYGVNTEMLKKANVYPISHKIITKSKDGFARRNVFKADKHAYAFIERKEERLTMKIYQPYNTKGFKWCSSMDSSVISLWTMLPERGDRVIICSSLKDALCIMSQLDIPAIALQGEGYRMSETAIEELKRRFHKVFISFDTDKAGIQDAAKLEKDTGFINIVPDLGSSKDFSDYYKSLSLKEDFKKLRTCFI